MAMDNGYNVASLWKLMTMLEDDNIESGLSEALEDLLGTMAAQYGAIWIKNAGTGHIYSIISVGENNIAGFAIEYGRGVIGSACEKTEPLDLPDVSGDERFPGGKDEITGIEMKKGYSYAPDTDKKAIMSLRGITKDYPSGMEVAHILKGVDLDIYENELLVILGESGCGKTTLLNIIGGMDSLTDGSVTIDGKDFSHPTEQELVDFRRDYIGFIFQSYNL